MTDLPNARIIEWEYPPTPEEELADVDPIWLRPTVHVGIREGREWFFRTTDALWPELSEAQAVALRVRVVAVFERAEAQP